MTVDRAKAVMIARGMVLPCDVVVEVVKSFEAQGYGTLAPEDQKVVVAGMLAERLGS